MIEPYIEELRQTGDILSYSHKNLKFSMALRNSSQATIEVTNTNEVFFLTVNNTYGTQRFAYTDEEKEEVLKEYFEIIKAVAHGSFTEKLFEKAGKIVKHSLVIVTPSEHAVLKALDGHSRMLLFLKGYKEHLG